MTNDSKFAHLKSIAAGDIPAPSISSSMSFWSHEPHKPLIGEIVGFSKFEHPSFGEQETVIVKREDGEVVSAILTNYLKTGLSMQKGEVGDLVLIEKQGQERSKTGKMFNKFQLVVEKQNPSLEEGSKPTTIADAVSPPATVFDLTF
jgi:hypothetical protein